MKTMATKNMEAAVDRGLRLGGRLGVERGSMALEA